ncbi:hypothetical protein F183_A24110 [Bryobacterales bacterium F-183]|nr:hypothetical protein F183_A24110 [Bryobacterales bacterium F-183]
MKALLALVAAVATTVGLAQQPKPPAAGKVEIFKEADLKPGMQATAWTVFQGTEAEPVPIEIIGIMKNAWGPKQNIILGKMGGKAARTNVAGGMSGSPVYIDGKLVGAVALRLSVFSPDAICGITPIESMLEINEIDQSRPADPKVPGTAQRVSASGSGVLEQAAGAGATMVPIDTPVTLSGFTESTLREFGGMFQQMGLKPAQGGATGALLSPRPVSGWQNSLKPGEAVAGILVSGDMSMTGLGTVSYNDGKRVLAFGHPFFNLGPINMPMSKGEILMVLSSAFQPNKIGNATEIVGALRQDRHSGIMGLLGETAEMIPVNVKMVSHAGAKPTEKKLNFNVFVHQKWTPFLMMVTLFNSLEGLNDHGDNLTYKVRGNVQFADGSKISALTMQAPTEAPMPPTMALATWWGDKFNKLFLNQVDTPKLDSVDITVDLIPERRSAQIEQAWVASNEVEAGGEVPVRVFLRPFRGPRIERELKVRIPANMPKGDHRIVVSDADSLNRMQAAATSNNRFLDIAQTVSLLNQERSNTRVYVSLVENKPTVYSEDKMLPSLPASVLNVMQSARTGNKMLVSMPETAVEQASAEVDYAVSGSYALRVTVK